MDSVFLKDVPLNLENEIFLDELSTIISVIFSLKILGNCEDYINCKKPLRGKEINLKTKKSVDHNRRKNEHFFPLHKK